MELLSTAEQTLLKIGRAISDLRLGLPVSVNNKYLFISTETLKRGIYQKLIESQSHLFFVVKSTKASFITKEKHVDNFVFFEQAGHSFEEVVLLTKESILKDYKTLDYNSFDIASVELAIKLTSLSELLPTLLMFKINSDTQIADHLMNIDSQDLLGYLSNAEEKLSLVAEANLNLKDAVNAKILAFRPDFIGQEHYAIIIGDINKVDVPMVRIHSSCYTGDLMASLSCDCRDQLIGTVQKMGESQENAGIILYMMQEGRGIGLTNKIRTYKLQAEGYDTVEANHLLGFDEDERSFDAAASILKKLNISKINLLTNNPVKRNSLEKHEIEISKTISLFGYTNKYNEAYISKKKDKMGHKL